MRVGGVADPGEAVVPVLAARRGSPAVTSSPRRRSTPLGRVQQQLEQQRAARDVVRPRSGGAELAGPLLPGRHRAVQPRVDLARGGQVQRLGLRCRHAHQVPGTGGGAEGAVDGLVGHLGLDLAEQPHRERHVVDAQDGAVHGVVRPGRRRVQAGAGGDREPHRHPARDPLDAAGELRPGQPPGAAEVQRVDDPDRSGRGDVRGLEDVRARQVAPHGARGLGGGELEPAAVAGRRGSRRTWGRSRGRGSATSRSGRRGRRARRCGCRRSGRRSAGRRSRPGDRGRRRAPRRGRARGRA